MEMDNTWLGTKLEWLALGVAFAPMFLFISLAFCLSV